MAHVINQDVAEIRSSGFNIIDESLKAARPYNAKTSPPLIQIGPHNRQSALDGIVSNYGTLVRN
jgi:hypothetical protein